MKDWFKRNKKNNHILVIFQTGSSMRDGYNTCIGDNGINLSGGQKQKIGLIRALIQDKPIIFMDEVTAGIDSDSKKSIKEGLKKITNKIIIFVTHDIESIVPESNIYAVENKKIVQKLNYL